VTLLTLEELRALPEAHGFDGGIYFLWADDFLQYVGMSSHVRQRMVYHAWAINGAPIRKNKCYPVRHDRHTCLVLETGRIKEPEALDRFRSLEAEYIKEYMPPYNSKHAR
jgi:hypothetical protein